MADDDPFRIERDSLGEVRVPRDALYGPQTARARAWSVSRLPMPIALVHALARIKACAAHVHGRHGRLPARVAAAIEAAALEVADGAHDGEFVLDVFQTGSGTSTNMNANEVIATLAQRALTAVGEQHAVHPNDDVNRGQSSNDVVPSALQLALCELANRRLLPAIDGLVARLHELAERHWRDLRDGRTHLMRATPIRFGQQFRGQAEQLADARQRLAAAFAQCAALPLGGTAVGTGVGCPPGFAAECCQELSTRFGVAVAETTNHLAQGSLDAVAAAVAAVRGAATTLYKVTEDLRWQASDALSELDLPAMQPGSSIMPGKVNPVVCEAVTMVSAQVFGNDAAVQFANSQGRFELNTMIPVVAHNALQAVELLADGADALARHALSGVEVRPEAGDRVAHNPILATGLNAAIGYDRAAEVAKRAQRERRSVKEVARETTELARDELDRLLDPERLCGQLGRSARRVGGMENAPENRSPDAILASTSMSRDDKIRALRELAYDAREAAVADEEGMAGGRRHDLAAIQRALRSLDADDGVDGDTKQ